MILNICIWIILKYKLIEINYEITLIQMHMMAIALQICPGHKLSGQQSVDGWLKYTGSDGGRERVWEVREKGESHSPKASQYCHDNAHADWRDAQCKLGQKE